MLPFFGRAYWFVTTYILLICLAPALNFVINRLTDKQLAIITAAWGCMISVFPTIFFMFPWEQENSNIGLFILLYFSTAVIKRHEGRFCGTVWRFLWLVPYILLLGSALIIHKMSFITAIAKGREMFLFRYNFIPVIAEGILLFVAFAGGNSRRRLPLCHKLASASLVIYLIHMHPVIKEFYTQWGVFRYFNVIDAAVYLTQFFITVFGIVGAGIIISIPVLWITKRIMNTLSQNIIKRSRT